MKEKQSSHKGDPNTWDPTPLIPALGGRNGSDKARWKEEYKVEADRSYIQSEAW